MATPGHLPPVPPHLSAKHAAAPHPPPPSKKPHLHPPKHFHQPHSAPPNRSGVGAYEMQPTLQSYRPPVEGSNRSVSFQTAQNPGASDDVVESDTDPYEYVDRQNQPVHIDMDDDNLSSVSSRSSLVSNAPSVQHFNISFIFKKTFREHEGARAFKSIRAVLKVVYMCSLRWTYNFLLFTLGILVTFIWAVINGSIAFLQAWVISPLTRVSLVVIKGILPLILDPLSLILKACAQGCCGAGGYNPGVFGGMQGFQGLSRLRGTFGNDHI